ncbi:MAG: glycosyltransferase [Plesiomonas sp.]|uniref:glycosyltransferase n=1 Tax=Plesiomonas sp. TaxID=2486279 RepID=UPI003F37DB70
MNNHSPLQSEVKNIIFLVLSSGITYGGITSYCNMYYEEFRGKINFYFIYTEADYSKGLRNTLNIKDHIRIKDLFDKTLTPSDSIIISTRVGIFNEFFRKYPTISIKYPVIVEHHSNMLDYLKTSKWLTGHFLPEHSKMTAINAIKVFTKAEAFEVNKFFNKKILSIPNPSLSHKKQEDYNPNKVVFVARLNESEKNLTMLVNIAYKLKSKNKNIKIHIYGDGPDREIVEKISDIAVLHGRIDDKNFIYSDACIVISTSNKEGFGLTLLEGAAYGVPAISTKHCPAVYELITHGENGYLFDTNQEDEFVDAINKLCTNKKLRASFSDKSKSTSLKYNKETVMTNYLNEMKSCIKDNERLDLANSMSLSLNYFAKCYSFKLDENKQLRERNI